MNDSPPAKLGDEGAAGDEGDEGRRANEEGVEPLVIWKDYLRSGLTAEVDGGVNKQGWGMDKPHRRRVP